MQKETIENVVCASCGWRGKRKTGQFVECPRCGEIATFEIKEQTK